MIQPEKKRFISIIRKVCLGFVLFNAFCQYLLHDMLFSADRGLHIADKGYDYDYDMKQLILDENNDGGTSIVEIEEVQDDVRYGGYINLPILSKFKSASTHQIKRNSTSTSPSPIEIVKIVAFADRDFAEAAEWWYERMSNLTYTTHTLILIDNEAEAYFNYEKENDKFYRTETWIVQADGLKPQQRAWTLWKRRIEYCLEQLKKGQSLLLTDVDNIFRRYEPLAQFQEGPYDAIYALASKFPVPIYKKQGFTLCGGMTFLKSTKGTIAMMERILASCGERCDDQVQMNLILEREMEWDFNMTSAAKGEDDLVQDGFVGVSNYVDVDVDDIISFKAKVWDREFAWRGRFATDKCPPVNTNWVAMPGHTPEWLQKKYFRENGTGRRNNGNDNKNGVPSKGAEKVARVKIWEHYCGEDGTHLNLNPDKEDGDSSGGKIAGGNPKRLSLELAMAQHLSEV